MTSDRDPQGRQPAGPVSPQPDEEFLLGRVRRGDRDAFEELVRRKSDKAYRLARRVVGDDEDARDVVQGALLRVWGERARFRPGSAFDPWFHRIVVNLAIDTLRRETVQRRSRTQAALEVGTRAGGDRISRPQVPREMRHDEDKPKRRLEDNYQTAGDQNPVYDYGDMAGLGWELNEWELWWREVYLAPRGRRWPGDERRVPLHEVFFLLRKFWLANSKIKKFAPNYPSDRREDFNAAGRLFLDVAQVLDGRYTAEDCKSVYKTCRKSAR